MTSVLSRTKQIPSDTPYFISLVANPRLHIFNPDTASSTTSYVSGAAEGNFTASNPTVSLGDASGSLNIFRDLGVTILSSGRTFRGVQLLGLDGTNASGAGGGTGWTSTTSGTAGVWKASNEGIQGNPDNSPSFADFGVFFFETGARGLGIAQSLVRYG